MLKYLSMNLSNWSALSTSPISFKVFKAHWDILSQVQTATSFHSIDLRSSKVAARHLGVTVDPKLNDCSWTTTTIKQADYILSLQVIASLTLREFACSDSAKKTSVQCWSHLSSWESSSYSGDCDTGRLLVKASQMVTWKPPHVFI